MKKLFLVIGLSIHLSAFAGIDFQNQSIIEGLTPERMGSMYWEKLNLKLKQAVQFVVVQDLAMGSVKTAVNREYFFYRDQVCEVSASQIEVPLAIAKGSQYALVDYLLMANQIEMTLFSVDRKAQPAVLHVICKGISQKEKIKDLQQVLQMVFILKPGAPKKFLGLF